MSFARGHNNNKNAKRNAREQRLQFMNNQAALIAQKKKEIEEKLAQQQNPNSTIVSPVKDESNSSSQENTQSPAKATALPFKNDGSFLEQFRMLQQQQAKKPVNSAASPVMESSTTELPIDIAIPPPPPPPPNSAPSQLPMDMTVPPPSTFLMQNIPQYHIVPPPPPPPLIKQEIKREARSPSPYSPSRPCEDDDDPPFSETKVSQLELHQPGPSNSSQDTGNAPQSSHNVDLKRKIKEEPEDSDVNRAIERERKRQSRWGPQQVKVEPGTVGHPHGDFTGPGVNQSVLARSAVLTRITSADPQILQYAVRVFGTTDLSEDQWKQCMDQIKMQYVYQEMLRKKQERDMLEQQSRVKYEYDSDEDTEGGTWEHKRRMAEMEKTRTWAEQLTEHAKGKHHLGDFLPPEELAKFMDKFRAVQEGRIVDDSDYKEFKIAESNVGYQMLKKFGWTEGQGLGLSGSGITAPVNAGRRNENQGLGVVRPEDLTSEDDEYDAYRKRMMLAYRFRPNPLNNPRRSYY